MITSTPSDSTWPIRAAKFLTLRRIRAHAMVLAMCLWGIFAVDFLTPGSFDRAANIKFQDFLSFYLSGKLIAQGRTADLYNEPVRHEELLRIAHPADVAHETVFPPTAHTPTNVHLPNLYGPQFALLFVPLSHLPFLIAAQIWTALNLILFFICLKLVLKSCPALIPYTGTVTICALAFPPLFHFFVRGQNSVLVLACFTAAYLAFRAQHDFLAGIALGFLIFKPQFLVAIPLVLLLSQAWKPLAALVASAAAQLAFARIYFGPTVMNAYFDVLRYPTHWLTDAEVHLAPIQMHSLRSFWTLLIPWPQAAFSLYILTAIAVIATAAMIWKSSSELALRFSALTLAAVLVNPHLFVYDLLVLAPALLLLADWTLTNPQHSMAPALRTFLYLAFALPLFGPLSHWTHLQLSVPTFAALLWLLSRVANHELGASAFS